MNMNIFGISMQHNIKNDESDGQCNELFDCYTLTQKQSI